jgi:hypothetical protein
MKKSSPRSWTDETWRYTNAWSYLHANHNFKPTIHFDLFLELLLMVKTNYLQTVPLRSASCTSALVLLFCADLPEAPVPSISCVAPLSSAAFSASPFAFWNSEGCSLTPELFQHEH